jgi:glycerol-3-phosphate acyltransferase PlsY
MERSDAIHVGKDHAKGVSGNVILALSGLFGYLIGSIPIANLVAARTAGVDLRTVGDRNPGFWNAMNTLGGRRSSIVFVGDASKGILTAGAALMMQRAIEPHQDAWWITYVAVGAAMVGHAFPLFGGFRGGRSVLTFAGGMVVAAPLPALGALAVIGVLAAASGHVPRAIRVGVAAFPIIQILIEGPYRTAATGVLMTFIGIRFATAGRNTPDPSTSDAVG